MTRDAHDDTPHDQAAKEAMEEEGGLLAIDLGLKMGLAHFDHQGKLLRYHAQRLANKAALKRHVPPGRGVGVIEDPPEHAVQLGGAPLQTVFI